MHGQQNCYIRLVIYSDLSSVRNGFFLSDCNWTRTHNHLIHKRTLNHLAKLPGVFCFVFVLFFCCFYITVIISVILLNPCFNLWWNSQNSQTLNILSCRTLKFFISIYLILFHIITYHFWESRTTFRSSSMGKVVRASYYVGSFHTC